MRPRSTVVALLLATVMLPAAGCAGGGESAKAAAQILSDARAAADGADSVHISGTVARSNPGGAGAGPTMVALDVVLTAGGDGREQISGDGQDIDLIKVGSMLYVKGLSGPGAPGGYQRFSVQDPRAAPLVAQVDMKTVFSRLIGPGTTATVTGSVAVAGEAAVVVTPDGGIGRLYVADDAAHPYPLKVETIPAGTTPQATAAQEPAGSLEFTEWNSHIVVSAPAQ